MCKGYIQDKLDHRAEGQTDERRPPRGFSSPERLQRYYPSTGLCRVNVKATRNTAADIKLKCYRRFEQSQIWSKSSSLHLLSIRSSSTGSLFPLHRILSSATPNLHYFTHPRPCESKCQFPMTLERIYANVILTELKVIIFVCSFQFFSIGFVFSLSSVFLGVSQETCIIRVLLFRFLFIFYMHVFPKVRGFDFRWEFHS
jgi:hypothetical protein